MKTKLQTCQSGDKSPYGFSVRPGRFSAAILGCGFCGHPCPQFERAARMPPEPAGPSSVAVLRRVDKDADATLNRYKSPHSKAGAWFAALLLFVCLPAFAQPYVIDWFTLDGGGGVSTGGVYTIQGTIGQPDAGLSSGGPYSLVGGFWGVVEAVQTPGAPLLSITLNPQLSTIHVSWPLPATGFVLDQSPTVTGTWSQVAFPYSTNATHIGVTVSPPGGDRFYRLRKP